MYDHAVTEQGPKQAPPKPEAEKAEAQAKAKKPISAMQKRIRERLQLVNPELAKDLLDVARAQVQAEVVRHGRLDAKAISVVTAAGVSITVAFSVAGSALSGKLVPPGWLLAMFAAAGVAGLITVLLGTRALLVQGGYAEVNDKAVFEKSVLDAADEPKGVSDLIDKDGRPERKDVYAFGAAVYKQHITAHLWHVFEQEHEQLDRKAKKVKDAQISFMVFLALIFACEMSLFGVIYSDDAGKAACAEPAAAEGAERRQGLAGSAAAPATVVMSAGGDGGGRP